MNKTFNYHNFCRAASKYQMSFDTQYKLCSQVSKNLQLQKRLSFRITIFKGPKSTFTVKDIQHNDSQHNSSQQCV
jgi:hypothetical protein